MKTVKPHYTRHTEPTKIVKIFYMENYGGIKRVHYRYYDSLSNAVRDLFNDYHKSGVRFEFSRVVPVLTQVPFWKDKSTGRIEPTMQAGTKKQKAKSFLDETVRQEALSYNAGDPDNGGLRYRPNFMRYY